MPGKGQLLKKIPVRFEHVLDHFVTGFLIIIVANVPQGVPATVMSQLRIIGRRMANKHVLIKKLELIGEFLEKKRRRRRTGSSHGDCHRQDGNSHKEVSSLDS